MSEFCASDIKNNNWRQGAILDTNLIQKAIDSNPKHIDNIKNKNYFIVISHDCDILNSQLDKEPYVEIICGTECSKSNKFYEFGKNSRKLQIKIPDNTKDYIIEFNSFDRFLFDRRNLSLERPKAILETKERRIITSWIAKRYTRAAFPDAFNDRLKAIENPWRAFLTRYDDEIQGIYIRLNKLDELKEEEDYDVDIIIATSQDELEKNDWIDKKKEIETKIQEIWKKAKGISLYEANMRSTDNITLREIMDYMRIDMDWISFSNDSSSTPIT